MWGMCIDATDERRELTLLDLREDIEARLPVLRANLPPRLPVPRIFLVPPGDGTAFAEGTELRASPPLAAPLALRLPFRSSWNHSLKVVSKLPRFRVLPVLNLPTEPFEGKDESVSSWRPDES